MTRAGVWQAMAAGALACAAVAQPAWADSPTTRYVDGMMGKLGRGVANIVTGPLELIRVPTLVGRADGLYASITAGLLQGLWRGVAREVGGAYEVVTFFLQYPDDFAPVVRPDYVWKNGNWAEETD